MIEPATLLGGEFDRSRRFDRVLLELSMSDAVTSGDLQAALHEICTAASRALDVDRTNVWLFDPTHTVLRESVAFASAYEGMPPGEIPIAANPPYFAALQQQRILSIDDVYDDPRTERFGDAYLRPRGITSTLDAAIRLHGRLLGVICHEHVGPIRSWDAEEERFAASLGDLVALAVVAVERAAAQREARATAARYRLLVDGVRDVIFNLARDGTFTSLNPAIDALGYAPGHWIGRSFVELLYPDDVPLGMDLFQRAMRGEDLPNFEIRLHDAAGHALWFEFTISREQDAGSVRHVFGVGREITARKQAETRRRVLVEIGQALARSTDDMEQALHALHGLLADALGCSHVATVLSDPATGDVVTTLRHPPSATSGEAGDAFPPRALVERTLRRAETVVEHARERDEHGTEVRVATVACPLRTPDGTLGALVARRDDAGGFDAEQIDLLDRVARELVLAVAAARRKQETEENAALSAALARVAQALITSLDMPRLLDRLCRVTAEVLGCDASYTFLRDEAQQGFVRAASYGEPPQVAEALRAVPILDAHTHGLVEALERDWVVVAHAGDGMFAGPLWDAYGTRSTLVFALLHGTKLVGAQAASLRDDRPFDPRHVRIAQGIAQLASLAIANARLVGELEAASRIKSDFVATMSHELRTPLNVIIGYTDLLLLEDFGALASEQSSTLERVRASAAELQELIEATLDLSRLESGAVALRLEDVDLRDWIGEVQSETAVVRERAPQLDVRWEIDVPPAPTRCDVLKLKVIVKNLLSNAIKFTPQGSVAVRIVVQDGELTLTVRDTGIGMTPDVQRVIFDAFRQGDASMTRAYGGVGLGLYIVRRLVDALHGTVEVDSAPGCGSTFRVVVALDPRVARPTLESDPG